MTNTQQRAELQRQIWQIANDVRGAVDGWDFKQFVLGTLFIVLLAKTLPVTLKAEMKVSIMPSLLTMSSPQILKTMPLKQKDISSIQVNYLRTSQLMPTAMKA